MTLAIYNILGQRVRALIDDYQEAGYRSVVWDGKDEEGREVASGIYFYTIKAGELEKTRKMSLIR